MAFRKKAEKTADASRADIKPPQQQQQQASLEPRFTKAALLGSRRYGASKDLISVLVGDEERCGHEEVERRIQAFIKKEAD
ncbi:hypothetical protein B8V81_1303 [Paenibacillus pasadenensis]|uniref:Uncharacterized protein n=1 Tax=Paenibacillus pasadenensis TaxID=217090 RepID=A0A2N5N9S1_9BACL|nr:hypothetical protein [Paenibacillus pasadenensis]PLT47079.1 hypothetical protein B8V81_1303 [Paenibacillus pasadenensis]